MATATKKTPATTKSATSAASKKTTTKAATETKVAAKSTATAVKKTTAKTTPKTTAKTSSETTALESKITKASTVRKAAPKKVSVSPEHRYHMISTAAYFLAERRGFAGGYEMQDWISAEAEIDAKLKA